MYVCMYVCVYVCMHACMVCMACLYTSMHVHTHINIHMCIRTHTHTHIHMYICTHTQTHTHAHTHTHTHNYKMKALLSINNTQTCRGGSRGLRWGAACPRASSSSATGCWALKIAGGWPPPRGAPWRVSGVCDAGCVSF